MEKKIKNLIFDWGGVLINLNLPRCIEAFHNMGYPVPALQNLWDFYGKVAALQQLERGFLTQEGFCTAIREKLSRPASDETIIKAWESLLEDIPAYRLEALWELRNHYRLFLLSNTSEMHWEGQRALFRYNGHEREDYFEKTFLSYRLHLLKPQREIFEQVLHTAGIRAEETFFIDDSAVNCAAAEQLGISTYCPQNGEDWRPLFDEWLS